MSIETNEPLEVHRWNNAADFVAQVKNVYTEAGYSWYGDINPANAKTMFQTGYEAAVERSLAFTEKIENALTLPPTGGFEIIRSPFGARANVGDWLSGSPVPCRRKVKRQSDIAPIKIVVGIFTSAGVRAEDLARRGEAIIAFLQIVQRYRPVELYVSLESSHTNRDGYRYGLVRLESKPLNLSEVGFVIGHPGFFRAIGIGWFQQTKTNENVPMPYQSVELKRQHLGLEESDIYIDCAKLTDPLVTEPINWIKREVARILEVSQ